MLPLHQADKNPPDLLAGGPRRGGCGGGEIRTRDLQLMRLACYRCTTPLGPPPLAGSSRTAREVLDLVPGSGGSHQHLPD